jgi:hypothetical protein
MVLLQGGVTLDWVTGLCDCGCDSTYVRSGFDTYLLGRQFNVDLCIAIDRLHGSLDAISATATAHTFNVQFKHNLAFIVTSIYTVKLPIVGRSRFI